MADKKAEKKPVAALKTGDDRRRALEVALGKIEKDFGKGSVMRLGDAANHLQVEVIPTGCLHLDSRWRGRGLLKGRIVEIYGPESSGKTTFALHAIAEAQKAAACGAYRRGARADLTHAQKLGVILTSCMSPSRTTWRKQALDICEALVRSWRN